MWVEQTEKKYCCIENRCCDKINLCCTFCRNKTCENKCKDNPEQCKYFTKDINILVNFATKSQSNTDKINRKRKVEVKSETPQAMSEEELKILRKKERRKERRLARKKLKLI